MSYQEASSSTISRLAVYEMKVMHFHFGKDGGTERFFINLANALSRRGVSQLSYIRPGRLWRPAIEAATEIIESHYRRLSLDGFALKFRVRRRIERERPDALVAWTPKACRLFPSKTRAVRIARLGDYPPHLEYYRNVDVLVCNAPDIAAHVIGLGWKGRVEIISNFTRVAKAEPVSRADLNIPDDATVIMAMGRLIKRKGFDVLINAVARLPGAYLWVVGQGEEREALQALAAERGFADRVLFLGWQQDVRPYLAASDIFVMPSRFEPLGNVVLEAWAQDRPVVSTRSQGPVWFMRDEENGLLVDIDDVEGLSKAMQRLIDDPDLRARIISGGRRALDERFSEASICDAYLNLFETGNQAL